MTTTISTEAIAAKWQQLQDKGLALGEKVGLEQDAGFEGRFQQYENGRIYSHEQLGTFEVHGVILDKYQEYGGAGTNHKTGVRELGFPTTDETRTQDGLYPVSHFEGGAIYWISGVGGVCIHSAFYQEWRKSGGELGEWGYPITDAVPVAGGEAVYFQRGCMWKGPASKGQILFCRLYPPLLGRPKMLNPDDAHDTHLRDILIWEMPEQLRASLQLQPDLFERVWDKVVLQRVLGKDQAPQEIPLIPHIGASHSEAGTVSITLAAEPQTLSDRTLYDITLILPGGGTYDLAPHAVYTKRSWENFGFIHATDLHISRRVEDFRRKLREVGMVEGAEKLNNFNDGLRDLIRYANHLHEIGAIDLILVTGDVTDYIFEQDDAKLGGGNFAYFEQLVRGQAPSPEGEATEELRVPIFTILGNHDYRPSGYDILCDLDLGDEGGWDWWPDWLYRPTKARDINGYSSLNLIEEEARAILGGQTRSLDERAAYEMVRVDPESLKYYHQRINDQLSYTIDLGRHRIIMIDSRWELGIVEGTWRDYMRFALNNFDEDARNWLSQHPNCMGFEEHELAKVKEVLEEADEDALVIVGVHAPPINPSGDEWPHYFRETEHPTADERETLGYLMRRDPKALLPADRGGSAPDPSQVHPDWIRTGTPYFKKGSIGDLLDYGIARGSTEEFLEFCVGQGVPRKVDLVLCGHIHTNVEYRLEWGPANERFLFYTDFYTENPDRYYATLTNVDPESGEARQDGGVASYVQIEVKEGAQPGARPIRIEDNVSRLEVQPYPKPLNSSDDPRSWWAQHRPLVMQSASLGSMDRNVRTGPPNASFQGFRVISVEENVMSKIRHVALKELRQCAYIMPWEEEIIDMAHA